MEINIKKIEGTFQFTADNGRIELPIVATPKLSKTEKGFRPMELVLVALGSCMAIDVVHILEKQKQKIKNYQTKVSASRVDVIPAVFEHILVEVFVEGAVDAGKLERAVSLSAEKYCSVYKTLNPATKVEFKSYVNYEK